MGRTKRNDEPGLVGKIALVALIGKGLGGLLKLGAMAGAAFVGWTVGRKAIDRFAGGAGDRSDAGSLDRRDIATDVTSP
jgi:hypothetical protein